MDTSDTWVILGPAGEVVLICSGQDSAAVVDEWRERGYRTVQLAVDAVSAA